MTHLHFWLRREGDIARERYDGLPFAQLDNGRIVKFHIAGPNYGAMLKDFLAGSVFHWKYLGTGQIYQVDGVVPACTDQKMPAKRSGR